MNHPSRLFVLTISDTAVHNAAIYLIRFSFDLFSTGADQEGLLSESGIMDSVRTALSRNMDTCRYQEEMQDALQSELDAFGEEMLPQKQKEPMDKLGPHTEHSWHPKTKVALNKMEQMIEVEVKRRVDAVFHERLAKVVTAMTPRALKKVLFQDHFATRIIRENIVDSGLVRTPRWRSRWTTGEY